MLILVRLPFRIKWVHIQVRVISLLVMQMDVILVRVPFRIKWMLLWVRLPFRIKGMLLWGKRLKSHSQAARATLANDLERSRYVEPCHSRYAEPGRPGRRC